MTLRDAITLEWRGPRSSPLTFEEYTKAVDEQRWPDDPKVPLPDDGFKNENGTIQNLLHKSPGSISILESVAGAVRANHWHRTDYHYAFVVRGRVAYYERAIGSTEIPEPRVFSTGEMFFTPPMREHAMRFEEETTIITFARRVRSHEEHESDVVRVDFIKPGVYSTAELNGR